MQQFKYALFDIRTHKRINIFFLIQMAVVFIIFSYCIGDVIDLSAGVKQLKELTNAKAFICQDYTSNEKINQLIADSENSIPKLQELYNKLLDSGLSQYTIWGYQEINSDGVVVAEQATANQKFFEFYDLDILAGRSFEAADFVESEVTPIIVGYNLRETYKLGETYRLTDGGTGTPITCIVVGVLKNNVSYPNIQNPLVPNNLNYTYLKPFTLSESGLTSFSDLDMAFNSTVVFSDDEQALNSIVELSRELDLFSIKYVTVQDDLTDFLQSFFKPSFTNWQLR